MITIKGSIAVLLTFISLSARGQTGVNYKFSFGPNEVPGYIRVDPSRKYSTETKYGFDFGTLPETVDRGGKNPIRSGLCTSQKPFFFSVALPEGNYNIRIITGDLKDSSVTTVRAESRRLLFERIVTLPGRFRLLEATVNIRVPEIAGSNEKVIKRPRELYKLDWDEKLTFEFTDSRPCICALEITRSDEAVTIFLAGNSTVVDQDDDPWASWGQMFPRFLKKGIAVANHAESGLSLGTFISSNRLKKVLSLTKPGDYPAAARLIAEELNVPFIDLNNMTRILYESLGEEESKKLFVIYPANSFPWEPNALNDNTHFNSYGAYELAKCIVRGISENNPGIKKFIVKGYVPFDPSEPDDYSSFSLPVSPHSPVIIDPANP